MSSNKGKDGEMKLVRVVSYISQVENTDFTRPTNTNTADMGADLILEHPQNYLPKMLQIASGEFSPKDDNNENIETKVKTRIDVKATDKKIGKDTVEKFISDTRKHPDCTGHILIGGNGLTGPAKRKLSDAQENFVEDKKELYYISNEGIKNLERHYKGLIESDEDNSDKSNQ